MYINQFLKIIHTSVKIKCQVKEGKMPGGGELLLEDIN